MRADKITTMIELSVKDETAPLNAVILGRADSFGGTPTLEEAYDPKSKEHILNGTFPLEQDLLPEMESVLEILEKHGVQVFRPDPIRDCNQVFARDIGFVIDDKLVIPNILPDRKIEQSGLDTIIKQIHPEKIYRAPVGARLEGGDVMPWKGKLFVGYSEQKDFDTYRVSRTNVAGIEFLKKSFPHYEIHAFELNKSDDQAMNNALHLDCCFQPIGHNQAIIYKGGFKNEKDYQFLINYFGRENCIEITKEEMYRMFSNVFSISTEVIISEKGFSRLNDELRLRGFQVEEVPYAEVSKMEGLLRCSTLPLHRS